MKKRLILSGLICVIFAVVGFLGYTYFYIPTHARLSVVEGANDVSGPRRVMFIAHSESWGGKGLLEIYQKMKEKGHDIKIVAVPYFIKKKLRENIDLSFFQKFDSADVIYPCGKEAPYEKCDSIDAYKPDYVFIPTPYDLWETSIMDPYFMREHLKTISPHVSFIVYGPHLFHCDLTNHRVTPEKIDLAFVDSESTKKIYVDRYHFPPEQVIVSGYQSYKETRAAMERERSKDHKETILWLPRWALFLNQKEKFEGGSTFMNYHYFFYNYAKAHPDINFIIRPHMLLKSYAVESQFMSQEDFNGIIERFKALPNVRWSDHATVSLIDDIIESDIVISDGTSALGEVVVAGKPIIYLGNGWDNEFNSNDLSREFKSFLYMAYRPYHILKHMDAIRKNDHRAFKRSKLRELEVFKLKLDPVENPADYITDYVSKH